MARCGRGAGATRAWVLLAMAVCALLPGGARAGTLFGLKFEGTDTSLVVLPTADPKLNASLVTGAFALNKTSPIAVRCPPPSSTGSFATLESWNFFIIIIIKDYGFHNVCFCM